MLKQVYKVDANGYLQEVFAKEFNEQGNCLEELAGNTIIVDPPQGLYRAKWTGVEWVEDMSQEEMDELNNQHQEPTEIDYLIDLDFRISMIELGL